MCECVCVTVCVYMYTCLFTRGCVSVCVCVYMLCVCLCSGVSECLCLGVRMYVLTPGYVCMCACKVGRSYPPTTHSSFEWRRRLRVEIHGGGVGKTTDVGVGHLVWVLVHQSSRCILSIYRGPIVVPVPTRSPCKIHLDSTLFTLVRRGRSRVVCCRGRDGSGSPGVGQGRVDAFFLSPTLNVLRGKMVVRFGSPCHRGSLIPSDVLLPIQTPSGPS